MNDSDHKDICLTCSKAFLILLMIGILFNNEGCAAVGHGAYSWPTFVGDSKEHSEQKYPVLDLSGIAIEVFAQNSDSFGFIGPVVPLIPIWQHADGTPFWIGVHLDPQAQEFAFDPFKVIVQMEGRQPLIPEGFTGPFMATKDNPRAVCAESFNPKILKSEHATFSVIGDMCFGIAYNILTPKPDEKFYVFVEGLEQNERSVTVPKIRFEKKERRGWSFCLTGSICTDHWTMR